jgi:hypothetical protein
VNKTAGYSDAYKYSTQCIPQLPVYKFPFFLLGQTASANGLLPTAGMFSILKNKKEKKCIHSIYIEAINSYLSGLEKKKKKV